MSCLQILAKAPIPGQVKTRMQPHLNPLECVQLHKSLLHKTLQTTTRSNAKTIQLWCHPNTQHVFFTQMQKRFPLELISQRGQDLGERMLTAINQGLLTHNAIILIGSDCPFFSADYLNKAFQLLQSERDLVLGPAKDGGFVLLGANRYLPPDFFKGVIWGENTALEKTLKRVDHYHFRYETLQPLQDIDRPEDLRYFQPTTSYK